MAEPTSYQGGSLFLRWWPPALVVLAVVAAGVGGFSGFKWATLLVLVAYLHSRFLPWQFTLERAGLALAFPFGRRVFIPKASLTVRMETVGATALVGRHRRFGYLLLDSILYVPGRTLLLHTALTGLGYKLS
jgi:hypothetical protein